ncbi:MAG: hypothetical protein ACI39U_04895, partial [Candidatus Cryptobacteroides sp.]
MRKFFSIAVLLLAVSCGKRSEIDCSLDRLDSVIEQKESYRDEFEENARKMRRHLAKADGDSLKWVRSEDLFWIYYHHHY